MKDAELLAEYLHQHSDDAFQALVRQHADLVFGTALRRTGDPGAAEEITQNVFVTLARKAMWLQSESSLAGWLHRATLLEARQWWRGEMRRRHREQIAASEETTMKLTNANPPGLADVLDEGLMELREGERQAVLLRYFEGRNHREIGAALGIGEDAARKRVDKALEQLGVFFRQRGLSMGSSAALGAALASTSQAAPAGLAATAAQLALAKASATGFSLLGLWLARFLGMTRTQTAALCAAVLFAPVLWQGARLSSARQEQRRMEALLAAVQTGRETVEREQAEIGRQLRRASNSLAAVQVRSAYLALAGAKDLDLLLLRWDESVDYVRVPKAVLRWLTFESVNGRKRTIDRDARQISATLLGVLGFTGKEQANLQTFCQSQIDAYRAAAESRSYLTNMQAIRSPPPDFVRTNSDTALWWTPALAAAESEAWRRGFEQGLTRLAGDQRAQIILRDASDDYSITECFHGFGSENFIVAVTPLPDGGCQAGRQDHFLNGDPRWFWTQKISFSAATNPSPVPPGPGTLRSEMFWLLGSQPLPPALRDYLLQWRDSHPEAPDEPAHP